MVIYAPVADAASRIKDLVDIEGIRENQLVGYGLVVGLNGTGDKLNNSPFTRQSLESMLERLGVNTRDTNLRTKNVAAVMVTANLPPFSTQGTRIDITVSALGDSKSLQGGTLLVTPLKGPMGKFMPLDKDLSPSLVSRRKAMPPQSRAACQQLVASPTAPLLNAKSNTSLDARTACASLCATRT